MAQQVRQLDSNGRWPADVAVWHVAMPLAGTGVNGAVLDGEERERALRYRRPADRTRYAVTRAVLRELLGQQLGTEPASLRFAASGHGRPELAGFACLSFNVSHSGDHALIAISGVRKVGIDIERVDPALDWQALTGLVCAEDEQQVLMAEPVWLQRQSFFRCWTAKEAVLKTLGLGIAEGLRALAVQPAGDGIQHPVVNGGAPFAGARTLQYHWLTDIPGYMGCVAFGEPQQVHAGSAAARVSFAAASGGRPCDQCR